MSATTPTAATAEHAIAEQPTAADFYVKLAEAMAPKVAEAIDYDKLAEALLPKLTSVTAPAAAEQTTT